MLRSINYRINSSLKIKVRLIWRNNGNQLKHDQGEGKSL